MADSRNNRICRIDRPSGRTITIAGSGAGGFDGDRKQAAQAALNGPSGLAVARNGDLYIADTLNNRVRLVEQATGMIRTIAGTATPGDPNLVGDGGPAVAAHLLNPVGVALAPNGDVYIADTGHNRIRRVDAATGIITTVAGDGLAGAAGDGGPAAQARLAAPMGVAVVPTGKTRHALRRRLAQRAHPRDRAGRHHLHARRPAPLRDAVAAFVSSFGMALRQGRQLERRHGRLRCRSPRIATSRRRRGARRARKVT